MTAIRVRVAAAVLLAAAAARAQSLPAKAGTFAKNSPHADIYGLGCEACHTPPATSGAIALTEASLSDAATFQRFVTPGFGTYESIIRPGKPRVRAARAKADARVFSYICISCHDGVITPTVIPTTSRSSSDRSLSLGWKNDHPVTVSQDPSRNRSLNTVSNVRNAGLVLFGSDNSVQCTTCHDPHDPTNRSYLRVDNTGPSLCLACHS